MKYALEEKEPKKMKNDKVKENDKTVSTTKIKKGVKNLIAFEDYTKAQESQQKCYQGL